MGAPIARNDPMEARKKMNKRRAITTLVAMSSSLASGGAQRVLASETWCDTDPPVLITTPAGNLVVVYVANAGPVEHITQLLVPAIDTSTRAVAGGLATQVRLTVTVTDTDGHRHAMRSEVWTGPLRTGKLLSSVSGSIGEPLQHQFRLEMP